MGDAQGTPVPAESPVSPTVNHTEVPFRLQLCEPTPAPPSPPPSEPSRQERSALTDLAAWRDRRRFIDRQRARAVSSRVALLQHKAELARGGIGLVPFILNVSTLAKLVGEERIDAAKARTLAGVARFLGFVLDAYRDGSRAYIHRHKDSRELCGIPDRTLRDWLPALYASGALMRDASFREWADHPGEHSQSSNLFSPGLHLLELAGECLELQEGREPVTWARCGLGMDDEGSKSLPAVKTTRRDAYAQLESSPLATGGGKVSPETAMEIRPPAGASLSEAGAPACAPAANGDAARDVGVEGRGIPTDGPPAPARACAIVRSIVEAPRSAEGPHLAPSPTAARVLAAAARPPSTEDTERAARAFFATVGREGRG